MMGYLIDKLVDPHWHRSHHYAIEQLIVAFIFSAAHVDYLPLEVYKERGAV